ncbi:hypothetical protein ACFYT3_09930 [Nocardia amikacinitolerans]|uniref:hypothetical protein n=1 Tax=Nocardia amikacinitolerans TaxID=756689 RepID=UPI0036739426
MNRTILAITAAAVLTGAVGCSSTSPDTTLATSECRADRFAPPFQELDPCSAEPVLTAAVSTVFGYRPRQHADPRAAFRAASALMDPRFAEQAEPAALVWAPITIERFQHWQHDGVELTTTVRITADDHPPDTATNASRVLAVTLQPENQADIEFAVYAHARRASASSAWLLSGMEVAV